MHAVEINNLSFKYVGKNKPALDKIDLSIKQGEILLLAGRSGSGKSTLLKCINGLIPNRYAGHYSGDVYVMGERVRETSLSKLSTLVGTVMQEVSKQFVVSTVEDDVAFGLCNLCLPIEEIKRRIDNTLNLLKVSHLTSRDVNSLSGGEKQRVALAGVLASYDN